MADTMSQRQLRNQAPVNDTSGSEKESDDLASQRAETERLQRQAQGKINAGRRNDIGVAP